MNHLVHKCLNCKRAFNPTKIDQKYCCSACRQAAYRRRKQRSMGKHTIRAEKPLLVAFCEHCGGSFWAQRGRARFCSTSCRTLYHRALKDAMPQAIMALYGLPRDKAIDIVETQAIAKVRELLEIAGYTYRHSQRQWQICSQKA